MVASLETVMLLRQNAKLTCPVGATSSDHITAYMPAASGRAVSSVSSEFRPVSYSLKSHSAFAVG